MPRNVYFFAPHQDDEVLFMAQAIAHHVLAGRPVHVVLMSTGATSGVLDELNGAAADPTWWGGTHDPASEGYAPLSAQEFGLARTREWSQACRHLGVPPEQQHFGAGLASSDELPDSITQGHATAVMQHWLASDLAAGLEPPGFYAMHWADPHSDHAACGQALRTLRQTDPAFSDSRWMVKPEQAAAVGAAAYAVPAGLLSQVKAMQKHAAVAYGAWAPGAGAYAVGMHSVRDYFANGPLIGAANHIVRNP